MSELLYQAIKNNDDYGIYFTELLLITEGKDDFETYIDKLPIKKTKMCRNTYSSLMPFFLVDDTDDNGNKIKKFICAECYHNFENKKDTDLLYNKRNKNIMKCFCECCYQNNASNSNNIVDDDHFDLTVLFPREKYQLYSDVFDILVERLSSSFDAIIWFFRKVLIRSYDVFSHFIKQSLLRDGCRVLKSLLSDFKQTYSYGFKQFFVLLASEKDFMYSLSHIIFDNLDVYIDVSKLDYSDTRLRGYNSIFSFLRTSYESNNFLSSILHEKPVFDSFLNKILKRFQCRSENHVIKDLNLKLLSNLVGILSCVFCDQGFRHSWFQELDNINVIYSLNKSFSSPFFQFIRFVDSRQIYNYKESIYIHKLVDCFLKVNNFFIEEFSLAVESGNTDLVDGCIEFFRNFDPISEQEYPEFVRNSGCEKLHIENFKSLNSLKNRFLFGLPLHSLLYKIINVLMDKGNMDLDSAMKTLNIKHFDHYILHPLQTIAAIFLIQIKAFVRNSDFLFETSERINSLADNSLFLDYIGLVRLYVERTDDYDAFVASLLEAFDLNCWINNQSYENGVEMDQVVSVLVRFLVILFSEDVYSNLSEKEKCRIRFIHFLYLEGLSTHKLLSHCPLVYEKASGFTNDIWYESLNEVTDSVSMKKTKVYRLKPEFESERSSFFPLYTYGNFNQSIANETKSHSSFLKTPQPNQTYCNGFRNLIESESYILLISTILDYFMEIKRKTSSDTCMKILLSLIFINVQIMKNDSMFVQTILTKLVKHEETKRGPLFESFFNKIKEVIDFNIESSSTEVVEQKSNSLLKSFSSLRDRYSSSLDLCLDNIVQSSVNGSSEQESNQDDIICCFCTLPINVNNQGYGMLCRVEDESEEVSQTSKPLFYTCHHYCHFECYKSNPHYDRWVECPLCKVRCSSILPVLVKPEDTKLQESSIEYFKANFKSDRRMMDITLSFFKKLSQLLNLGYHVSDFDYMTGKSIVNLVNHLSKEKSELTDIHKCLQNITGCKSSQNYADCLKDFKISQKDSVRLFVAYKIFHNESFDGNDSLFRNSTPRLFIDDLPKHFTELFLRKNGYYIERLPSNESICRCLLCGCFAYVKRSFQGVGYLYNPSDDNIVQDSSRCKYGIHVYVVLTGDRASSVIYSSNRASSKLKEWGFLYKSGGGDLDCGLSLHSDLVIDNSLVNQLKIDIVNGKFAR